MVSASGRQVLVANAIFTVRDTDSRFLFPATSRAQLPRCRYRQLDRRLFERIPIGSAAT